MMKQGQFGRVDCTTTTTTTTGSFWTLNEWASQQRRIGVFLFGIDSSAVDSSAINDNGFEYDDHMRSMQYLPRCWLCRFPKREVMLQPRRPEPFVDPDQRPSEGIQAR
jgi:hypothetical protein